MSSMGYDDTEPLPTPAELDKLRRDLLTRSIGCLWIAAGLFASLLLAVAGWVGASDHTVLVLYLWLFAALTPGILLLILGGKPWLLRLSIALSLIFVSAAAWYWSWTPPSDAGRESVSWSASLAALAGGASLIVLLRRRLRR